MFKKEKGKWRTTQHTHTKKTRKDKIIRIWITTIRHGGLGHSVQESWRITWLLFFADRVLKVSQPGCLIYFKVREFWGLPSTGPRLKLSFWSCLFRYEGQARSRESGEKHEGRIGALLLPSFIFFRAAAASLVNYLSSQNRLFLHGLLLVRAVHKP